MNYNDLTTVLHALKTGMGNDAAISIIHAQLKMVRLREEAQRMSSPKVIRPSYRRHNPALPWYGRFTYLDETLTQKLMVGVTDDYGNFVKLQTMLPYGGTLQQEIL